MPNVGDLQWREWKRGETFPLEQQQMQLVGERIDHGSAEVLVGRGIWRSSPAPAINRTVASTCVKNHVRGGRKR